MNESLPEKVDRLTEENPNSSQAEIMNMLSDEERAVLFEGFSEEDFDALIYDADFWLRPKQKFDAHDDWYITAFVGGRGTGKSRATSEWVRKKALENPGCRIAVGGRTVADTRNTMVTGDSGILAVHPDDERPEYKQHTATLHWPNGSQALLLSSESPDQARGPQFHYSVGDEFAAWKTTKDASGATLYSNLIAATRLGQNPQLVLATTPKRTEVMKDVMKRSKDPEQRIRIVKGSTLENTSLSESYIKNLLLQYGDSDLARQEIDGDMLEDAEGIVFSTEMLEKSKEDAELPRGLFKMIAVDPTVSADPKTSDECGIMVFASTKETDPRLRTVYLLEDRTIRAAPEVWAQHIADVAKEHHIRDIVAEKNQGGALITSVIRARNDQLRVHLVWAAQGKVKRVEPVAVAMQQGRVKLTDYFIELEEQLEFYDPDNSSYSPDRMDAFAWGVTALAVDQPKTLRLGSLRVHQSERKTPTSLRKANRLWMPRRVRR